LSTTKVKNQRKSWLGVAVTVTNLGVEPTDNTAERAIRSAVIWRRTSFGSQTQVGSLVVARTLTVATTSNSKSVMFWSL